MIILFPIASVFIRFWFELISVLFSINSNIQDIKGVFTDIPEECCDEEGCCGCCAQEDSEEGEEAPAKKETKKSVPKKTPTKKTTKK